MIFKAKWINNKNDIWIKLKYDKEAQEPVHEDFSIVLPLNL